MYKFLSSISSVCICIGVFSIWPNKDSIPVTFLGFGIGGITCIIGVIADKVSEK